MFLARLFAEKKKTTSGILGTVWLMVWLMGELGQRD